LREKAGIPRGYTADVVAEAAAAVEQSSALPDHEYPHVAHTQSSDGRADITDVPFVTLDPPGAKDLDQAVWLEKDGSGWTVLYAIADVGAHVLPGGAIDRDTQKRGETVYCPDMRVALHPPAMSEGFASLLPGQRTKAAVWRMTVDSSGELKEASVERGWVRSRRQYSYPELSTPGPQERGFVDLLGELGAARRAAMRAAGAVTLPKPSQEVVVTEKGLGLEFRAARGIEDDNAQVSLLTGVAAARFMLDAGVGILRTMPAAEPEALERLRRQAHGLGVTWRDDESYADVLDRLDAGSPQGAAFLVYAVTLFRGARWEPFDTTRGDGALPLPELLVHGALAAPYAHVTAPLRRLVDRFGAEICLAVSAGNEVPQWVKDSLPGLGEAMGATVRRNAQVDRGCVDAVESAVLAPHVGELFVGIGLDSDTVQLPDPAVVARCHGDVQRGQEQHVRLESARLEEGPKFSVVDNSSNPAYGQGTPST
jgi:exoribonuclease R